MPYNEKPVRWRIGAFPDRSKTGEFFSQFNHLLIMVLYKLCYFCYACKAREEFPSFAGVRCLSYAEGSQPWLSQSRPKPTNSQKRKEATQPKPDRLSIL